MSVSYLIYLVSGKVLIFFGMKFAEDNEIGSKFIRKLLSCGLCWGWWVYSILAFIMNISSLPEIDFTYRILTSIVTGGISSLLVHLVSIGWKEQFLTIVIK